MLVEINEENFNKNVENGLKLIEFYTPWCGFCKKQDMVFDELPNIWVGKINGDENPKLVHEFNVSGYPSFVLFKNGEIITEFSGYHDKNNLIMRLAQHIK